MSARPCDPAIGKRTADAILERSIREDTPFAPQLEVLHLATSNLYRYRHGKSPSAEVLARMAQAGYDVMWILTGRRSDGER